MQKQNAFMNVVVRRFAGARQRLNPRPPKSPPFLSQRGVAVRALPALSKAPPDAWPHEDCANEPSPLHCFGEHRALWTLGAKVVLLLLLAIASLAAPAAVREIDSIGLTVDNLGRSLEFYTGVLSFDKLSESQAIGSGANDLLGLSVTQLRSAELKLGDERITLTEHLVNKGRPIPRDSRSFDHWFQHIAIVVSDMDRAYEHLRRHRVKHVSTAPQTLPAWNKDAGGIKAFYFCDPEDHVLEIIWFPPGKGDPKWQRPTTNLFLGIDHTAIVLSDTERSLAFYRELLGLRVAGSAENHGVEQEHLNQVFGARLRITALRAERGPGIEFLEYIAPPGGRPLPADAMATDLVFWHTKLAVNGIEDFAAKLREQQTRFVSTSIVALPGGSSAARSVIVRDPDGHALQFIQEPTSLAEK
jgi:catechol 2,3-dioxygenase-like lactoylglutathione lyase family enzyme